jgi:hypothetical protein
LGVESPLSRYARFISLVEDDFFFMHLCGLRYTLLGQFIFTVLVSLGILSGNTSLVELLSLMVPYADVLPTNSRFAINYSLTGPNTLKYSRFLSYWDSWRFLLTDFLSRVSSK